MPVSFLVHLDLINFLCHSTQTSSTKYIRKLYGRYIDEARTEIITKKEIYCIHQLEQKDQDIWRRRLTEKPRLVFETIRDLL